MIEFDKSEAILEGYGYSLTVAVDGYGEWGLRLEINGETGGASTAQIEGSLRDLDRLLEALGKTRAQLDSGSKVKIDQFERKAAAYLEQIQGLRERNRVLMIEKQQLEAELKDALENWKKEREEWRAEDPDRWDVDQVVKNLREREAALNVRAVELERYNQQLEARSRKLREAETATSHQPHTDHPTTPQP